MLTPFFLPPQQMKKHPTSPARKTYRVWADHVRRVFQEVEAQSPEVAYELARERPECWEDCSEHEDRDDYRLSDEVQDVATEEAHRISGDTRRATRGSEIIEGSNDRHGRDGECGAGEDERSGSCRESWPIAPTAAPTRDDQPAQGPWTPERWAAARSDSRWAAERSAAALHDRLAGYPTLHAEDKIRLALDILWDVNNTWDHDTLDRYPDDAPSFDEFLADLSDTLYAIRWFRTDRSPTDAHGNAA